MWIECIPNVSEGRNRPLIERLATIAESVAGVRLVNVHSDVDHNRTVFTLIGEHDPVCRAMLALCEEAVARIDLRNHDGVHPRIGAIDVVPMVPFQPEDLPACAAVARHLGREIADRCQLPVFFYEASAEPGRPEALPALRRRQFEDMQGQTLQPDAGPASVHPSAGACVVGARRPMIAYNVNLSTDDLRPARRIARHIRVIRDVDPRWQGVRCLAFALPSRRMTQVSMNITRPECTPLDVVYASIKQKANTEGVETVTGELVGCIPVGTLAALAASRLGLPGLSQHDTIDIWP